MDSKSSSTVTLVCHESQSRESVLNHFPSLVSLTPCYFWGERVGQSENGDSNYCDRSFDGTTGSSLNYSCFCLHGAAIALTLISGDIYTAPSR